jgi:hypothetical protein
LASRAACNTEEAVSCRLREAAIADIRQAIAVGVRAVRTGCHVDKLPDCPARKDRGAANKNEAKACSKMKADRVTGWRLCLVPPKQVEHRPACGIAGEVASRGIALRSTARAESPSAMMIARSLGARSWAAEAWEGATKNRLAEIVARSERWSEVENRNRRFRENREFAEAL